MCPLLHVIRPDSTYLVLLSLIQILHRSRSHVATILLASKSNFVDLSSDIFVWRHDATFCALLSRFSYGFAHDT